MSGILLCCRLYKYWYKISRNDWQWKLLETVVLFCFRAPVSSRYTSRKCWRYHRGN